MNTSRATNLVRAAEEAHSVGEFARAIELYSEALNYDPCRSEIYHSRGETWLAAEEYDRAIEDYTMAIRLSPETAYYYGSRSLAEYAMGDHPGAIRDTSRAIKLGAGLPDDSLARFHYLRAMAHAALGETGEAEEDFLEGRKYDPEGSSDPRNF